MRAVLSIVESPHADNHQRSMLSCWTLVLALLVSALLLVAGSVSGCGGETASSTIATRESMSVTSLTLASPSAQGAVLALRQGEAIWGENAEIPGIKMRCIPEAGGYRVSTHDAENAPGWSTGTLHDTAELAVRVMQSGGGITEFKRWREEPVTTSITQAATTTISTLQSTTTTIDSSPGWKRVVAHSSEGDPGVIVEAIDLTGKGCRVRYRVSAGVMDFEMVPDGAEPGNAIEVKGPASGEEYLGELSGPHTLYLWASEPGWGIVVEERE